MECPHCGKEMRKAGKPITVYGKSQKWQCKSCGRYKTESIGYTISRKAFEYTVVEV